MNRPIPVGVERYKLMIDQNYYYVDKTLLMKEILDNRSMVSLFTRPRRFGKTLALDMLKTFFEDERDKDGGKIDNSHYFSGKKIADCGGEYLSHQGKYPVICLTLKEAAASSYELSYENLKDIIAWEFNRHAYILSGEALSEHEKQEFSAILYKTASENDYARALLLLSQCLKKYHGNNVVILLDEYDVPLEKAYFGGFYPQMTGFIRTFFGAALKTNDALEFAVVTGCLRISKESIFTGLNNLEVISILNQNYAEYFGFTEEEVKEMLICYGLEGHLGEIRTWYDGYLFGRTEIYNPWSIICCVKDNRNSAEFMMKAYWANTSSNNIIKELFEYADLTTREEIEQLLAGREIEKPLFEDVTYGDLHSSQDNIWSFLFFTGYLKKVGERMEGRKMCVKLRIPNEEIASIYENTVLLWFQDKVKELDRSALLHAIENGDCESLGNFISEQLQDSISYFDYAENYYHGFLLGLLKGAGRYKVLSNRESGEGRPDILMKAPSVRGKAFLFELKVAKEFKQMRAMCQNALAQAKKKNYKAELEKNGYSDITVYGVCFFQKDCMVLRQK